METISKRIAKLIRKIDNTIGLSVIWYALGFASFNANSPFEPSKFSDIRKKLGELDVDRLDNSLTYCKGLLDDENDRGETIQNKAFNLIGVTGISTAFITGISSLLPIDPQVSTIWNTELNLVLCILIVISLTLTILLAFRVIAVGNYKFAYPDISDVFTIGDESETDYKKERLASYVYCYAKNYRTHNIKASYLIGSQIWFRNAIILFLVLSLSLTLGILSSARKMRNASQTPTVTAIISPTVTEILTHSNTTNPTSQAPLMMPTRHFPSATTRIPLPFVKSSTLPTTTLNVRP